MSVVFDMSAINAAVHTLEVRAKNFNQSLLTALLLEHVEEVFDSEGSKGSDGKWEPLAPSTILRNPARAGGAMLFDTGILANFQSISTPPNSIVWSPASYAQAHVDGNEDLPKRNPFAVKMDRFMYEAERLVATQITR